MSYQIDKDRPVTIYGNIIRDLSKIPEEPLHAPAMKLAKETGNMAFLRLSDFVEGASFDVSAQAFNDWLDESGLADEFLRDLQCISQTTKGEPLLSSWVSWSRFLAAIKDSQGAVVESIRLQTQGWQSLGLDEVSFDFYAKPAEIMATKEALLEALTRIRDMDHAEACEDKEIPLEHCGCQPSPYEIAVETIGPRPWAMLTRNQEPA